MFSPKYWSRVSARISGKIDIENGYFDVAISKAKEVLGYEPKIDFEEGIKRYVEWFKNEAIPLGYYSCVQ